MTDSGRIGVVGARRDAAGGRRLLTMSDGEWAWVEPDLTTDQLADQYRLDRVMAAPTLQDLAGSLANSEKSQ